MNAAPGHRSQQTERDEPARLLLAAAAPGTPPAPSPPAGGTPDGLPDPKARWTTAWAERDAARGAPPGLAAALAGIALTAVTGHLAPPAPGTAAGGNRPPGSVGNAAYSLQGGNAGIIRLTILVQDKQVDVPQLHRDPDRLGACARIYAGENGCPAPAPTSPTTRTPPRSGRPTEAARTG